MPHNKNTNNTPMVLVMATLPSLPQQCRPKSACSLCEMQTWQHEWEVRGISKDLVFFFLCMTTPGSENCYMTACDMAAAL